MSWQADVAILGSCVTRDAFAATESDPRWRLNRYCARSTLGSCFGERSTQIVPDYALEPSSFRARVVRDDVEKLGREWLEIGHFDVLIYDPIDDRFPLIVAPDGGTATDSGELRGMDPDLSTCAFHELGTREHWDAWVAGWESFLEMLDRIGKRDHLVVHEAFWSSESDTGQPVSNAGAIALHNEWLALAYSVVESSVPPANIVRVPAEFRVSSASHQWGLAPYHYVPAYYQAFIDALAETAAVRTKSHPTTKG